MQQKIKPYMKCLIFIAGLIVIVSTEALVARTLPFESYISPLFGLII